MDEPIRLTVKENNIERSGVARIHKKIYEQLGLDDNEERIRITYDDKTIIRKAFSDDLIDEKMISLRSDAEEDLHLNGGEQVSVQRHTSIGEDVKEDFSEAKEDIKEKVSEKKEEAKEKKENKE